MQFRIKGFFIIILHHGNPLLSQSSKGGNTYPNSCSIFTVICHHPGKNGKTGKWSFPVNLFRDRYSLPGTGHLRPWNYNLKGPRSDILYLKNLFNGIESLGQFHRTWRILSSDVTPRSQYFRSRSLLRSSLFFTSFTIYSYF